MVTSREVFAKRKSGELDEAYELALQLINEPQPGEWEIKAFAWCVIDLIKRDAKSGVMDKLSDYCLQLQNLEINFDDDILAKNRTIALNLCHKDGQKILKAKELSKNNLHSEALKLYKQIFSDGNKSDDVQVGLAWELYRVTKELIDKGEEHFIAAKRNINDYFQLNVEKPSLLHSLFLRLADDLHKNNKINMGVFVKIWGLDNLRDDDYQPYKTDDGKQYPSLAEKVVQHASKDACSHNSINELNYISPYVNDLIIRYPDNIWLKRYKTKILLALGNNEEALAFAVQVVKNKGGDYWAWETLGDVFYDKNKETALACYCKALLCSDEINFVSKVKRKLADILIEKKDYQRAKYEIDEIIKFREKNNYKIPDDLSFVMNQSWYEVTEKATSNKDYYLSHSPSAESIIYERLPWINGILGESFVIKDKPKNPKRKLYIEDQDMPFEVSIPEKKVTLKNTSVGAGVRIKGEYDSDNRFQVYTVDERQTNKEWDIFTDIIGVIDHVNSTKKLYHFIVNRNIDGVIPFSQVTDKFKVGESVAICLSTYTSKAGQRYRVVDAIKTDEKASDTILKRFNEEVREVNGMGFTSSDIFISPNLMRENNIYDTQTISGIAVLNYNKIQNDWGWKALSIDS